MSDPVVTRADRAAAYALYYGGLEPRTERHRLWLETGDVESLRLLNDLALGVAIGPSFERSWWETRIRQLINSAEEERYGGGPVVGAGALENLIDERAASAKEIT